MRDLRDWNLRQPDNDRNESTTRFHLIDRLVDTVLGWSADEVVCEDSHDGTYADYVLGFPLRRIVVEAKREGRSFELPEGTGAGVMSLKNAMALSDETRDAIKQVAGYGASRGIGVAVATNGHQLIAFLASRVDGIPPLEGRALVFPTLDAMVDEFPELWNGLGQFGIATGALARTLGSAAAAPPPPKLGSRIRNYPGFRTRNRIQTNLKVLGDLFLTDYLTAPELEEEFLRECYSTSNTLSEYATVSKEILQARYSAEQDGEGAELQAARSTAQVNPELARDVLTASLGRRPLILLGDVGSGKSTFIRHFIRIDAREVMERSIVLHINFGNEPALADDLNAFVISRLQEQLLDHGFDFEDDKLLRQVYAHDLTRFTKGIYKSLKTSDPLAYQAKEIELLERKISDANKHLMSVLNYISKSRKQQIVVFLDNIDQRDFAFQEDVFLIGQSLAETWPATVFLSLRPETFNRSRAQGSLTAYQPRMFTIAPPPAHEVIDKRLAFSIKKLASANESSVIPEALEEHAASLLTYLEILLSSFRANRELTECVENLGGGNLRATLDFVNTFVGSGHVDTRKIFEIQEKSGRYTVSLHEFIRALLYGDLEHYNPASSPIPNLIDISTPDPREHFLMPLCLAHIERKGEVGGEDGFVDMADVFSAMQEMGFSNIQIKLALDRSAASKLLSYQPRANVADGRIRYRITTVGAYMHKKLLGRFTYLDAMAVDTPFVNEQLRSGMRDARVIQDRLDRAEAICAYLDESWVPLANRGQAFDWSPVREELRRDLGRIRKTVGSRA